MPIKTTGQFGEYAVAAELSRRGFIATTFTRNMPGFDILALSQQTNKSCRVQVKTVKSGEWSINAKNYVEFDQELFKQGIQKLIGMANVDWTDYIVFVKMNDQAADDYFILDLVSLQQIIHDKYGNFLKRVNGRRPRNCETTHCSIDINDIKEFQDNWESLEC